MTLLPAYDTLLRTADRLRVTLPTAPVARYQQLVDAIASMDEAVADGPDRGAVRQRARAAALRGDLESLGEPHLGSAVVDVRAGLRDAATELFAEHAEDLYAAFTPRFDEAAGLLNTAAVTLPRVPRLDRPVAEQSFGRTVKPRPVGDDENWQQARYAEAVMVRLQTLWKVLVTSPARFPSAGGGHLLLVVADVPPERWHAIKREVPGRFTPWNAAQVRLDFSLATPAAFRARYAALGRWRQEQEERVAVRPQPAQAEDPLAYVPVAS